MNRNLWAAIALISVAAAWGLAFVLMKDAITAQPIYDFLATRFTLATLALIAVRPQVLRAIDWDLAKRGIPVGAMLGLGYITQTIGLDLTTAAITGFLTGLYVVMTPILAWLILKQKVGKRLIVAVATATIALGLISITDFAFDIGQLWLVLCALLFAGHIVGLGVVSPGRNVYALTVVQLGTCAVICWVGAIPDGYQAAPDAFGWWTVIFTAIFATALAFFVQTWAQSIMDASRVAILLTSEVVFAAAIAVAVGQETLSLQVLIGGALMVIAMLVAEWPSRGRKQKPEILPYEPMAH